MKQLIKKTDCQSLYHWNNVMDILQELGFLKLSTLPLIVAAEEAEKIENTKWAQYFDTPCIQKDNFCFFKIV